MLPKNYALPSQKLQPDEPDDAEGDIREFNRPGEDVPIPMQSTDEYDDETARQLHEACFDMSETSNDRHTGDIEMSPNIPKQSTDTVETPGSPSGNVRTEVLQSDVTDDDLDVETGDLEDTMLIVYNVIQDPLECQILTLTTQRSCGAV